ncbi:MAG: hypothetical protein ACM3SY_11285 [Candidatus Omnitrophota bacterium]
MLPASDELLAEPKNLLPERNVSVPVRAEPIAVADERIAEGTDIAFE